MRNDPLVPVAQQCGGQASQGLLAAVDWALSVDERDRPQRVGVWREAMEVETAAEVVDDVPSVKRVEQEAAGQELARDVAAAEQETVDDAPSVKRVEQEVPPLERPKKPFFRRLVAFGVVALLVGGVMYVDHAADQRREQAALEKQRQEQAALEKQRREPQRQEQAFVAEVGRKPHPRGRYRGETDLYIAASLNLPVLTRSLIAQGAEVNVKGNDGNTPLHIAVRADASAMVKVLLENGAKVNTKDNAGRTPLHVAARADASAIIVKVLLRNGAEVNAKGNDGNTPLHIAARADASAMVKVLLDNGAEVNAKGNDGNTPLHIAARADASAMVKVLLENGADVNAKDNKGRTLLHVAARADASAMAKMLLENGADVNAKDNEGYTPLHWAAYVGYDYEGEGWGWPYWAVTAKDAAATAVVLLENGAEVNAKDNAGRTPLYRAEQYDAVETAEVLYQYDARR